MIQTRQDLKMYIAADRIMNGLPVRPSIVELFTNRSGEIIRYLHAMRHYAYYLNTTKCRFSPLMIMRFYWGYKYRKLGLRLGFSIGPNSLGYGVVIPHYGTIVVNGEAYVGNFAVLHTCTCIAGKKNIGDFFYLSTGSQVIGNINIGDGVSVAAHSLVNRSFEGHCLLAGSPAVVKRTNYPLWAERDGENFIKRVEQVRHLIN